MDRIAKDTVRFCGECRARRRRCRPCRLIAFGRTPFFRCFFQHSFRVLCLVVLWDTGRLFRLFTPVFRVLGRIGTNTAEARRRHITQFNRAPADLRAVLRAVYVSGEGARSARRVVRLKIVYARRCRTLALLFCRLYGNVMVIALILSTRCRCNENHRTFRYVPADVRVNNFKIVSGLRAARRQRLLRTVLRSLRHLRSLTSSFIPSANRAYHRANDRKVVRIIFPFRQRNFLFRAGECEYHSCVLSVKRVDERPLLLCCQRQTFLYLCIVLVRFRASGQIFVPVCRDVLNDLIIRGARLKVCVVLRTIVVAIRVIKDSVRRGYCVNARVVRAIRLGATRFSSVVVVILFHGLRDRALPCVSNWACIGANLFRSVVCREDYYYLPITTNGTGRLNVDVADDGLCL